MLPEGGIGEGVTGVGAAAMATDSAGTEEEGGARLLGGATSELMEGFDSTRWRSRRDMVGEDPGLPELPEAQRWCGELAGRKGKARRRWCEEAKSCPRGAHGCFIAQGKSRWGC